MRQRTEQPLMNLMVERFWPGATVEAVREAVSQLERTCHHMASDGIPIRYLGATFVPTDEALSCRFDGTAQAVRAAHALAGTTFDRLVVIHEMGADLSPMKGGTITARVMHGSRGRRRRVAWQRPLTMTTVAALTLGLAACGSDTHSGSTASQVNSKPAVIGSSLTSEPAPSEAAASANSVSNAGAHLDPCSLLTVAEIEAVVGAGVEQGGLGEDLPGRCTYSVGGDVGAGAVAISLEDPLVCTALQRAVDSGSAGQAAKIDVGLGGFVETYGTVEFLVDGGGCVSITGSTHGRPLSQDILVSLARTAAPRVG